MWWSSLHDVDWWDILLLLVNNIRSSNTRAKLKKQTSDTLPDWLPTKGKCVEIVFYIPETSFMCGVEGCEQRDRSSPSGSSRAACCSRASSWTETARRWGEGFMRGRGLGRVSIEQEEERLSPYTNHHTAHNSTATTQSGWGRLLRDAEHLTFLDIIVC